MHKSPSKLTVISLALLTLNAHAAITEFSQSGTTGTFQAGSSSLSSTANLAGSGNTYNYNSQFFTPGVSGTYTFGTSKANFDTVLIFYSGSFNPASPTTHVVALNDDSSGAQLGRGLVNAGNCASASWCSQLSANLTAGTNYYLVTTTFNAGTPISGTIWYYVDGVGVVGVGGAAAPSPPVTTSVFSSSSTQGNNPAFAAARIIDANSNLLNLFSSQVGNQAISNAASQTLPLLTAGTTAATRGAMLGINRIIQAKTDSNTGRASGDGFVGNNTLWMRPFASRADQDDHDGIAGYKAKTYGIVIGTDGNVSRALNIGAAFAYAKSDINGLSSIAPHNADVDIYQLIGYGSYALDARTAIDFQLDYGRNTNDGRRQIAFTSTVASSHYTTNTAHAGISLGRSYGLGADTTLTPSARIDYTWIKDEAYSETGADLLNLNVNSRSTEALVLGLDSKLTHQLNDQTTLVANLGVGYDTINKQNAITSAFAGAPSSAFVTYGMKLDPWLARGGFGAMYKLKNGFEITGRYDFEYRESFLNQTASANLRWAF